jgi:hypothetical protein
MRQKSTGCHRSLQRLTLESSEGDEGGLERCRRLVFEGVEDEGRFRAGAGRSRWRRALREGVEQPPFGCEAISDDLTDEITVDGEGGCVSFRRSSTGGLWMTNGMNSTPDLRLRGKIQYKVESVVMSEAWKRTE